MSETNDGGPAFPLNSPSGSPEYMPARDGMSLRDWFAGQALAGLLANGNDWPTHGQVQDAAASAYALADAMLRAREREGE
jgi:hypothetical protein